jgi:hypothetical protein
MAKRLNTNTEFPAARIGDFDPQYETTPGTSIIRPAPKGVSNEDWIHYLANLGREHEGRETLYGVIALENHRGDLRFYDGIRKALLVAATLTVVGLGLAVSGCSGERHEYREIPKSEAPARDNSSISSFYRFAHWRLNVEDLMP